MDGSLCQKQKASGIVINAVRSWIALEGHHARQLQAIMSTGNAVNLNLNCILSSYCFFNVRLADVTSCTAALPSVDGCVDEVFSDMGPRRDVGGDMSQTAEKRCPPPRPPAPQKRKRNCRCLPPAPPAPWRLLGQRIVEQGQAPILPPVSKRPRCLTSWDTQLPQASIDVLCVKPGVLTSRPIDFEVCPHSPSCQVFRIMPALFAIGSE